MMKPISSVRPSTWWLEHVELLLDLNRNHSPCFVYNKAVLRAQIKKLTALRSITTLFYAVKANSNPEILKILEQEHIGFECVSIQELQLILSLFPKINTQRIIFTPNFAQKAEYEYALNHGCHLTLESLYPLEHWPELFTRREVLIRLDLGIGEGHHTYVKTGGNQSKFGLCLRDLDKLLQLVEQHHVTVVGLHSHSGSGILKPALWKRTAVSLCRHASRFPHLKYINLGGGLGVPEKASQKQLNLDSVDSLLLPITKAHPQLDFWLEPGRYYVAECGVLLAQVTQTKQKDTIHYIGIDTGMNSLIRPALYKAYHTIVNLNQIHAKKTIHAHIVGPICESGDILGADRFLPPTTERDTLLIENAGAYGYSMSSAYNLRPPATELII